MNVSLTPELNELVRKKVATGMYHSASEVIREALRLFQFHDDLQQQKLNMLKLEIKKGVHSLDAGKGVEMMAIVCSGACVYVVLPEGKSEEAVLALAETFEIPKVSLRRSSATSRTRP